MTEPKSDLDVSGGDASAKDDLDISGGDASPKVGGLLGAYGEATAPGTFLGEIGGGFKRNLQGGAEMVQDLARAVSKKGGLAELQKKYPPLGSVGDVLSQTAGSLNPVVVKRDESGAINYPGTAGATIGNLAAMLATGKAVEPFVGESLPSNQVKTLSHASGTSPSVNIPEKWATALPKLQDAVATHGSPSSIPELTKLVQSGLTDTQNEYGLRMQPIVNQQIVPRNIVNAITSEMVPNPKTADDRAWNQALTARAAEFSQPFSYGELDQQRMSARDRLNPFYGKKESAQGAVTGTRADVAVDRIIEREAREAIFDGLERQWQGQLPPKYFRDLKKSQSALIDLKDQLMKRVIEVTNMENAPLRERVRMHTYLSGGGHMGGAVGNIAELLFPEYKAAHAAAATPFTPKPNRLPQLLLSTAPNILGNTAPEE